MSHFDQEIQKMTKEALANIQILAYCQTCGENFLNIKAEDYLALSSHFTDRTPDRWFIEAGIHWVENDGHLILIDFKRDGSMIYQEDISKIWENKKLLDGSTKAIMKPHFYKYRERSKQKPI